MFEKNLMEIFIFNAIACPFSLNFNNDDVSVYCFAHVGNRQMLSNHLLKNSYPKDLLTWYGGWS